MSKFHIETIITKLENSKWIIHSDITSMDNWLISRFNNKSITFEINFTIFGNGNYGACIGTETINNASGCSIKDFQEIDLYFGKFSKQFQIDIVEFIHKLNKMNNGIKKQNGNKIK